MLCVSLSYGTYSVKALIYSVYYRVLTVKASHPTSYVRYSRSSTYVEYIHSTTTY